LDVEQFDRFRRDERKEGWLMKRARTIHQVAEVILNLVKVLGGNWSAIISLAMSTFELYAMLRGPEPSPA
jgi:hypothetical protein